MTVAGMVTEENHGWNLMILVTGASGQLASLIVTHLSNSGADVLAGSRTPSDAGRTMDFDVPTTIDLAGITTLVLVSAGYAEDDVVVRRHAAVLDAARRDGVRHVVYTSVIGTGDHLGFALAHRVTERLIQDSGLEWTIMRNGLYAELIGALLSWEEGALASPFGGERVAAPSRDDLAVAAARVAAAPARHTARIYELTGPSFTTHDIADVLGVDLRDLTMETYRQRLLESPGLLPFQPPMLASIATSIRHGFLSDHGGDLAMLLGGDPHSGLQAAIETARSSRSD